MQQLIAFDQATQKTGWAIVGTDGTITDYGVLKTPGKRIGLEAALWQANAVEEFVLQRGVHALALENLHFDDETSKDTIFLLGALRGMIILVAAQHNIRYELVSSHEVCNHIGVDLGTPREQKKKASRQAAALDLWADLARWVEIDDNAADAIAIGLIAWKRLRIQEMAR